MNKLKRTYIDKIIDKKATSKEIDFLLYIARFQTQSGVVESVYYKNVCAELDISYQTFYDILSSLKNKKLIDYSKGSNYDYRVQLIGNDFTNYNYGKGAAEGYLNVDSINFASPKFCNLKAGSKKLFLYSQRFTMGQVESLQSFYSKYCDMFHVTQKSIQQYIHDLKTCGLLIFKIKRNKQYRYNATFRRSEILQITGINKNKEKDGFIENVKQLIRLRFKKHVPADEQRANHILGDIVETAINRTGGCFVGTTSLIVKSIKKSLDIKMSEGSELQLNAAHINKCMSIS